MARFKIISSLVLTVLFLVQPAHSENNQSDSQLRRFEDEIDRPGHHNDEKSESTDNQDGENKSFNESLTDSISESCLGPVFEPCLGPPFEFFVLWFIGAPFTVPHYLTEDHYTYFGYQPYPFAEENGFISKAADKQWMVNTRLATQLLPGEIFAIRTDICFTFAGRFGLEGAYTKYKERIQARNEYLGVGEGLLTFIFAQNKSWNFRAGIGCEEVNGKNSNRGFKGVYRIRWLHKPIQLNLDLGLTGGLGASPLLEIAPNMGLHINRVESIIGYRCRTISSETLQGPEFALRFWF